MAKDRKRSTRKSSPTAEMRDFSKMARTIVDAGRAAESKLRKTGVGSTGSRAPLSRSPSAAKLAAAPAIDLGKKQADWVIGKRAAGADKRAKAMKASRGAALARTAGPNGDAASAARVLVAEGDSWFDYPFYDILKLLEDDYGYEVEKVSHRGDSVESMAYDGGQLDDFVRTIERIVRRGQVPHAILLSGGGNDVAGDGFAMILNHRLSPTSGLNERILSGVVESRIAVAYTTLISAVTQTCVRLLGTTVPILLHGYDYPVPDGRGVLGGWGPLPGPWLEPGFREKGYDDLSERILITKALIDRFNEVLASVVGTPEFKHVRVLDLRESLSVKLENEAYKESWGNEMHPTRNGFDVVTKVFADALK